jgi:hypothetical protein
MAPTTAAIENPLPALPRSICSLFCDIQKNGKGAGLFHPIPKSASLPCWRYCALSRRRNGNLGKFKSRSAVIR